jgi:serine/threonine-protein kinase
MQLISGEPLFVADGESPRPSPTLLQMTVEQKVRIMQKVAEGIQAAHRQGLIHRDVKPTNVMLETTADGDFKPYVLDFGLAREVAATGVTSHGLAAGTPNYMAPEQARGEAGALDRRTDVYGLGATLFAVLAGKPPFEGPSSLDVLVKVTEAEPEPLRGVPEDLAIIVAKCLRKEPAQRYESARAVAEDLGRYLGGEPILARPAGLSYRLLKKARKHRRLVAVGAVTLAAFLVLGTVSLQGQLRARERARLAAAFGQEVKAIETRMRIAFLIPEHDITPEREAIRRRMKAIETQMAQIGGVAQGPGHYALGRGYLVLRDYAKAREHLDAGGGRLRGRRPDRAARRRAKSGGPGRGAPARAHGAGVRPADPRAADRWQSGDPAWADPRPGSLRELHDVDVRDRRRAHQVRHLCLAPGKLDVSKGARRLREAEVADRSRCAVAARAADG